MTFLLALLGWPLSLSKNPPLKLKVSEESHLANSICKANNRAIVKHGLDTLPINEILNRAAQLHAERMRDHQFIGHHDTKDARFYSPSDRVVYSGGKPGLVSENLAQLPALDLPNHEILVYPVDRQRHRYSLKPGGKIIARHSTKSFAEFAVSAWLKSPGHRRNLLNKKNTSIGCGAAYVYSDGGPPMINAVTVFSGQAFLSVSPAKKSK